MPVLASVIPKRNYQQLESLIDEDLSTFLSNNGNSGSLYYL